MSQHDRSVGRPTLILLFHSVGEHTSVNHAWIFSALESATRGVVQILLDDGLVDEAKEVSSFCEAIVAPC